MNDREMLIRAIELRAASQSLFFCDRDQSRLLAQWADDLVSHAIEESGDAESHLKEEVMSESELEAARKDMCSCGHARIVHHSIFALGHGHCLDCSCIQYTWTSTAPPYDWRCGGEAALAKAKEKVRRCETVLAEAKEDVRKWGAAEVVFEEYVWHMENAERSERA